MDVRLEVDEALLESLMEVARWDAICSHYPLAVHVRQRLKARAEIRWVHAVARREKLPISVREVEQALAGSRPPRNFKWETTLVRHIGELNASARRLAHFSGKFQFGRGLLEQFHKLVASGVQAAEYRQAPRRHFFLLGLPELVAREELPKAVERVLTWLYESPLGRMPVLGPAVVHQELMLLTPFHERTPAVVDATTRCLLARHVNQEGLGVLEQKFAHDMNEYEFNLHDLTDAGRQRWIRYFVRCLAGAMRTAANEVLELRQHLEREPWLDAAPLTDRQLLVYRHVLTERNVTSAQVLKALAAC